MKIKGRIWKFGSDINTDEISPTKYIAISREEVAKHSLESVNPKFSKEVKPGDIIVAGQNFGCGSSREEAPTALKDLGIGAVVAESFARIFFRNSIAIGLPVAVCPDASSAFDDGDILELDLTSAQAFNVTKSKTYSTQPLPGQMAEVLLNGGIIPLLKKRMMKK